MYCNCTVTISIYIVSIHSHLVNISYCSKLIDVYFEEYLIPDGKEYVGTTHSQRQFMSQTAKKACIEWLAAAKSGHMSEELHQAKSDLVTHLESARPKRQALCEYIKSLDLVPTKEQRKFLLEISL